MKKRVVSVRSYWRKRPDSGAITIHRVMKRFLGTKGHIAKIALAGLTILLASFCSRAHALSWSPPQVIAGSARMGVSIAVDAGGNWHMVYDNLSAGKYYIRYLSSTGTQQIIAQADPGQSSISTPAIGVDSNEGLHVIYRFYDRISGSGSVMYTHNLSGSWSPPKVIAGYARMGVSVAVDAGGNWHMVYDTLSAGKYYIRYLSSTGTQQIIAQADPGQSSISTPAIGVDSNEGLHVIYRFYDRISGSGSVMYTHNLSGSWSPPKVIAGYARKGLSIAVDANGDWYVVYDSYSDSGNIRTYYISYLSSTGTDEIIAEITDDEGSLSKPALDIDSNGGLHVVYRLYNRISGSGSVMYTRTIHEPGIIYADADAAGANDGSSWLNAYNYLQDALDVASSSDEVRVAQGIYKPDQGVGITPGDREATFQLINGVAIKGGYAGFGEPDPNARDIELYETILSGDLNGDDRLNFANNGENSYHVVTGSGTDITVVLDGFTITSGNANSSTVDHGGGMINSDGSPTITNCTFSGNSTVDRYGGGGGMCNLGGSPTLTNCMFSENSASRGGGMCNFGGSYPTLTNCTFSGNWASNGHGGGGMYSRDGSLPTLTNCVFIGNSAEYGGGMRNWNSDLTLVNCTFSGNSASRGGGIENWYSGPTLTNCVLWGNIDSDGMDESAQIDTTSIPSRQPVVNYSCIQGWTGALGGTGNIGDNPLLAPDGYHLEADSPCINAGNPRGDYSGQTDIDGEPRVMLGRVDMGADEFSHIPVACIVGGNQVIEAEGPWGARVTLDGSCSSDADSTPGTNDDIAQFDWYKVDACDPNFEDFLASGEIIDCNLPLGEHIIVLEVIDKAGAFDTNEVTIIVQDTTPPDFTLSVTPTMLWPANHKMVLITPTWTAIDICDESPEVSLVSITMNEGDEAKGDGHTAGDIQIGDDGSIRLRAERSGTGSGRIYTITYQAVDDSGNAAVARATVTVPHDQR